MDLGEVNLPQPGIIPPKWQKNQLMRDKMYTN
jgi:hypothetical protein